MSGERDKHDPAGDLELELRQLLKQFGNGPISDELHDLVKKLEGALEKRKQNTDPD